MWRLFTVLGRRLGLIRPSGVLEVFPPNAKEEWWTLGGPSLTITERGIEGLFWPLDLSWPDKPAEGEPPPGAA